MDTKYLPAFLLRAYAWEIIRVNLGWKTADYGSLVPIVPVAEEPELTQYDKPYIVYGYADVSSDEVFKNRGSMTFVVYSTNFGEAGNVANVLAVAFGREDESARDINRFTSRTAQFLGMRFGTVSVGFLEGPTPEETEGGRQSAVLNIRYEYYVNYSVKTDV